MPRVRAALGIVAGACLVLSGLAHSLLGWPQLRRQLVAATAPPDLVLGVQVGWEFGGVAMLAFGIITMVLFAKRFRGEAASVFPAVVVAIAYSAFGIAALYVSGFQPFYLAFIVPAILLFAASRG